MSALLKSIFFSKSASSYPIAFFFLVSISFLSELIYCEASAASPLPVTPEMSSKAYLGSSNRSSIGHALNPMQTMKISADWLREAEGLEDSTRVKS